VVEIGGDGVGDLLVLGAILSLHMTTRTCSACDTFFPLKFMLDLNGGYTLKLKLQNKGSICSDLKV
jgi:hypothetical protein